MNPHRPLTVFIAIVLLILLSLFGLTLALPGMSPLLIGLYAFVVLVVGGLLAAFGLWKLKRWGWRLSSILTALSLLIWTSILVLTLVLGDTMAHVVWSLALTVCYALVLVLVALPATRAAFAAPRASIAA